MQLRNCIVLFYVIALCLDPIEFEDSEKEDSDFERKKDGHLTMTIAQKICKYQLFLPENEQKVTHISSLPMEIILYILKWVVSSDLDLRSLEMCSRVCRGFYLCSRDPEIWRLACIRAWGVNCGNSPKPYSSWRHMFIERSRLHFNGCYISKTTYIRQGENNFQDQFYRPCHLVAYYRYLRFFPEGVVLMMLTPEEPSQCVTHLQYRNAKSSSVLKGHYRLKNDRVMIIVQKQNSQQKPQTYNRRHKRIETSFDSGEQTFHLEFQIQNYRKRKHVQLIWRAYSIQTIRKNGTQSTFSFDLTDSNFPPLWFSRVKSYTAETTVPLS